MFLSKDDYVVFGFVEDAGWCRELDIRSLASYTIYHCVRVGCL